MYIAAIMNGAIDATLRLGTGLSVLKAVMTSFVALLDGWLSGSTFSIDDLFSKLLWNVILVLVTSSLVKKFTPKQGKALNQYIRKTFHVKGTTQYTAYYNLLAECVAWKGFFVSTLVNYLKKVAIKLVNLAKTIFEDCLIEAFDKVYA